MWFLIRRYSEFCIPSESRTLSHVWSISLLFIDCKISVWAIWTALPPIPQQSNHKCISSVTMWVKASFEDEWFQQLVTWFDSPSNSRISQEIYVYPEDSKTQFLICMALDEVTKLKESTFPIGAIQLRDSIYILPSMKEIFLHIPFLV